MLWKLLYALASGSFCLWLAAFTPVEGPRLTAYIPSNCGAVLHVRDGAEFFRLLKDSRPLREFGADQDANELFQVQSLLDRQLSRYNELPAVVRRLFPATLAGLYPLLGREWALVVPQPESKDRKPGLLLLTRLSGGRGLLVRLALALVKIPGGVRAFDLGGGMVALSLEGAGPAASPSAPTPSFQAENDGGIPPLLRLILRPAQSIFPEAAKVPVEDTLQFQLLKKSLPQPVLAALLQPPSAAEIFNIGAPPKELRLDVFAEGGMVRARGQLLGLIPPTGSAASPAQAPAPRDGGAFAEIRMPINLRAAYLFNLQRTMEIRSRSVQLSRAERRCVELFSRLRLHGLDLDRDFWPAFGNVLQAAVKEPPPDSAWRQGVIQVTMPFAGANEKAHEAAAIWGDMYWNYRLDLPPEHKLQHCEKEGADGYVLSLTTTVPAWILGPEQFIFTWDAGVLARSQPERAVATLLRNAPRPTGADSYYLRFDGQRMAGTVATLAEWWFNDVEEELGPKEFMDRYPDAPTRIRLARKLSNLLGQFFLEVKPDALKKAEVCVEWSPGTLKTAEASPEE